RKRPRPRRYRPGHWDGAASSLAPTGGASDGLSDREWAGPGKRGETDLAGTAWPVASCHGWVTVSVKGFAASNGFPITTEFVPAGAANVRPPLSELAMK